MAEKDNETGFKVVDRRPFATDGSSRESAQDIPPEPPAESPPKSPPVTSSRKATPQIETPSLVLPGRDEDDLGFEQGAGEGALSGFDTLVSYLGTTAMFQLGVMAGPGGERIPADLANARSTIDMLEVLEEKTRGNLTADETRLLEDVLYELRMAFVEVQKRTSTRPK